MADRCVLPRECNEFGYLKMAVILKCPACREKFKYDVSNGWPDECPICKTDINNRRADDDVCCPNILSFKTKNNDKVARDIMDGSVQRAEMAASLAGTDVSEMNSLKITDLNDRKDAQFSTKDVVNPVTQHMASMQAAGMPVGFGGPSEAMQRAAAAHAPMVLPDGRVMENRDTYAGLRERNRLQRLLPTVGQAPLPLQISNNPNYRSPV
jgi:hypothetical protein